MCVMNENDFALLSFPVNQYSQDKSKFFSLQDILTYLIFNMNVHSFYPITYFD